MNLQEIKARVQLINSVDEDAMRDRLRAALYRDLLEEIKYPCDSHGIELAIEEAMKAERMKKK